MAYTTGDTILDDHYNGFVASINSIWGSGSGAAGYGQTSTLSTVSAGSTITATQGKLVFESYKYSKSSRNFNYSIN